MTARSKAKVCGRSPAEIVSSNPTAGMSACCECCVLSGRGLCDGLITRPEESYWLWCVIVCDLKTSRMRRPWPALDRSATGEKKKIKVLFSHNVKLWWWCRSNYFNKQLQRPCLKHNRQGSTEEKMLKNTDFLHCQLSSTGLALVTLVP